MEDSRKEATHPLEPTESKKHHLQLSKKSKQPKTEDIQPMETTEPNKIRDTTSLITIKILIIQCLILMGWEVITGCIEAKNRRN